jgi:hypothetical protein
LGYPNKRKNKQRYVKLSTWCTLEKFRNTVGLLTSASIWIFQRLIELKSNGFFTPNLFLFVT